MQNRRQQYPCASMLYNIYMLPRFTPMVNMKRLKSRWFRQNKEKNSAEMLKMYGGSSDLHRRTPQNPPFEKQRRSVAFLKEKTEPQR